MKRFKEMNVFSKIITIFLLVMIIGFTICNAFLKVQMGIYYGDVFLRYTKEDGEVHYDGKAGNEPVSITVNDAGELKIVIGELQNPSRIYGPYTYKEDSTAITDKNLLFYDLKGIEVFCDGESIFRGGIDGTLAVAEDGEIINDVYIGTGSGYGNTGAVLDKPNVNTIVSLIDGPKLTFKGDIYAWLAATVLALITIAEVLFQDEIFYLHAMFRYKDPDHIEPTTLSYLARYLAIFICTMAVLGVYIEGLLM